MQIDSKFNKNLLRWILRFSIYGTILTCIALLIFTDEFAQYNIGKLFGTIAVFVFLVTITPGIIRRFKIKGWLSQIQNLLMFNRAHLGTLMFLLATTHYLLTFFVPVVRLGVIPTQIPVFELFGVIALCGSFPLFLTSNNFSKKLLKKNWNRLHALVYIIIWAIFAHVALSYKMDVLKYIVTFSLMIMGTLQAMSLVYGKLEKNKTTTIS